MKVSTELYLLTVWFWICGAYGYYMNASNEFMAAISISWVMTLIGSRVLKAFDK